MTKCGYCGFPTRDDRRYCPVCEGSSPNPDAYLEDGTPLYLKVPTNPTWGSIQLELYDLLRGYGRHVTEEE